MNQPIKIKLIKKHYYKTLGTSVINSPLSTPSLDTCAGQVSLEDRRGVQETWRLLHIRLATRIQNHISHFNVGCLVLWSKQGKQYYYYANLIYLSNRKFVCLYVCLFRNISHLWDFIGPRKFFFINFEGGQTKIIKTSPQRRNI